PAAPASIRASSTKKTRCCSYLVIFQTRERTHQKSSKSEKRKAQITNISSRRRMEALRTRGVPTRTARTDDRATGAKGAPRGAGGEGVNSTKGFLPLLTKVQERWVSYLDITHQPGPPRRGSHDRPHSRGNSLTSCHTKPFFSWNHNVKRRRFPRTGRGQRRFIP
ncbi:unnamed protein product, partial [Ectocarpus sp. 4 AP-2014]